MSAKTQRAACEVVARREGLKGRLRGLCNGSFDSQAEVVQALGLLRSLRDAACLAVEAIVADGRRLDYEGADYLVVMSHDLDFVAAAPRLVEAMGAPVALVRNNPLMLPRTLEDAREARMDDQLAAFARVDAEHSRLAEAESAILDALGRQDEPRQSSNTASLTEEDDPSSWIEAAMSQLASLKGKQGPKKEKKKQQPQYAYAPKITGNQPKPRQKPKISNSNLLRKLDHLQSRPQLPMLPEQGAGKKKKLKKRREYFDEDDSDDVVVEVKKQRSPVVAVVAQLSDDDEEAVGEEAAVAASRVTDDLTAMLPFKEAPNESAARVFAAALTLVSEGIPTDVSWGEAQRAVRAPGFQSRMQKTRFVPKFKQRALRRLLAGVDCSNDFDDCPPAFRSLAEWCRAVLDDHEKQERHSEDDASLSPKRRRKKKKKKNVVPGSVLPKVDEAKILLNIQYTCWWCFDEERTEEACLVTVMTSKEDERLVIKAYEPRKSLESSLELSAVVVHKMRGKTLLTHFLKTDLLPLLDLSVTRAAATLRLRSGPARGCAVKPPGRTVRRVASALQRMPISKSTPALSPLTPGLPLKNADFGTEAPCETGEEAEKEAKAAVLIQRGSLRWLQHARCDTSGSNKRRYLEEITVLVNGGATAEGLKRCGWTKLHEALRATGLASRGGTEQLAKRLHAHLVKKKTFVDKKRALVIKEAEQPLPSFSSSSDIDAEDEAFMMAADDDAAAAAAMEEEVKKEEDDAAAAALQEEEDKAAAALEEDRAAAAAAQEEKVKEDKAAAAAALEEKKAAAATAEEEAKAAYLAEQDRVTAAAAAAQEEEVKREEEKVAAAALEEKKAAAAAAALEEEKAAALAEEHKAAAAAAEEEVKKEKAAAAAALAEVDKAAAAAAAATVVSGAAAANASLVRAKTLDYEDEDLYGEEDYQSLESESSSKLILDKQKDADAEVNQLALPIVDEKQDEVPELAPRSSSPLSKERPPKAAVSGTLLPQEDEDEHSEEEEGYDDDDDFADDEEEEEVAAPIVERRPEAATTASLEKEEDAPPVIESRPVAEATTPASSEDKKIPAPSKKKAPPEDDLDDLDDLLAALGSDGSDDEYGDDDFDHD